ncbi:SpoIIE family protein phosphatase [Frankia sp. Cppng1_Ct_nod]|uniref:SpoIIE family protein phosphatase n=1 Tax=Frankia sp. Cppng1_Ct_nod TaxID=2897162 RepID=UPI001F5EAE1B|nr:SpoIIE family protein phosphatase [Frankia sp. Cppng1_Ct_nod]
MGADTRGDRSAVPPFATAILDRHGRIIRWSSAAEQLLGHTAAEVLSGSAVDLLYRTADAATVPAVVERCRAAGGWSGLVFARHSDGHRVDVGAQVCPLIDREGESGWLLLAFDAARTHWWRADQSILDNLFVSSPFGIGVLDENMRYLWVNAALERFGGVPREERLGKRLSEVSPGLSVETGEARVREVLETGVPVLDLEYQGWLPRDPNRIHVFSSWVFRLEDPTGRPFGVCFVMIDVTDHWRARQRLTLLNEASERIGRSLDVTRTAQDLADVAVPRVADFVTVDLLESVLRGEEPASGPVTGTPEMRRAGQQSVREGCPESVIEAGEAVVLSPSAARCLIDGKAVLEPVLDVAASKWMDKDPLRVARIEEFRLRSLMAVPIRARGVIMGVASFIRWQSPDPFEEDDLLLAEEFVSRAAVCIDNARRYTREHAAALALQRSLLPHGLPRQTAVDVASYYLPAEERVGVGGDWFDVIPLSGFRVALVVGDVVGRGLHAAATMGRLRTAVHTLAGLDLPPDELLAHLDDLVIRLADEEDTGEAAVGTAVAGATCVYAVYDPVSRSCTLARAGHPPPVVVSPDEQVGFLGLPAGLPLGLGGMPFESAEFELAEGSLLALYTNGLVEARGHDVDVGLGRLREALAPANRPLEEIRKQVIETLLPDRPDDDVAFLLARTHTFTADQVASWELAADPAVVSVARSRVAGQLAGWGFAEEAFTTELVVSELVTNAIRHASGPIRLRLIRDHTLICEVSDCSNTSPRLRHARTSDEGGRGLFLVAQFTQRWGARYTAGGKIIWAEQSLRPAGAGLAALQEAWDDPLNEAWGDSGDDA